MQTDFVRETGVTYMRIKEEVATDKAQMKMVSGNEIEGFLRVSERRINDELYFCYNISSLLSMETVYEDKEITASDMRQLVAVLQRAVDNVREYLLDIDGIALTPDKIFINSGKEEFQLCYFSGKGTAFEDDVKSLFEYIIRKLCHADGEAVIIAYGIYKRICAGENNPARLFEIEEKPKQHICEIIEERTPIREVIPETVCSEEEKPDKNLLYAAYALGGVLAVGFIVFLLSALIPSFTIGKMSSAACMGCCLMIGAGAFFGYRWFNANKEKFVRVTTVKAAMPFEKRDVRIIVPREKTEDNNLTVLLGGTDMKQHYLRWEDDAGGHKYEIGDRAVIVGSDVKKADCVIELPGVSRMHARISKEDDSYYIKDLNSTNGTIVDGKNLVCFELCEIKLGSKIILGNVECVFV